MKKTTTRKLFFTYLGGALATGLGIYTVGGMVAPEVADDVKKGFRRGVLRFGRKARRHEDA